MGIGSLSKYRRFFMIGGFIIFAGGALLRWHHKRQTESLQKASEVRGPTAEVTWQDDCVTYACRVVEVRGPECLEMCERAAKRGSPGVQAERIANACKKHCVADEDSSAACRSACLISEAHRLVD